MILSAQAALMRSSGDNVIIATTNVRHLALFSTALRWAEIQGV
jgi:hypothetical protein